MIAVLVLCYGLWGLASWYQTLLPAWLLALCLAVSVTLHSSLQHEALHGHPTRSQALNEALVFPALGLIYPYRRFRTLHLRHHRDERLTDPYDDPESWYLAEADFKRASKTRLWLLTANNTLLGRLLLGPYLGAWGFWRQEWRYWRAGGREARLVADAALRHLLGVGLVLGWISSVCGINPLWYGFCAAIPGTALLGVRTFIEHRAVEPVAERTAIVEAGPFWSLLFLNNNLHAAHHRWPTVPWAELPALYRRERAQLLRGNGAYVFSGYGQVFRRFFLRQRDGVMHPFLRRESQ